MLENYDTKSLAMGVLCTIGALSFWATAVSIVDIPTVWWFLAYIGCLLWAITCWMWAADYFFNL